MARILRVVPTTAYAKNQSYHAGERAGELIGHTGLWLFSTDGLVASNNLAYHVRYILDILVPGRQDATPLTHLHVLVARQKDVRVDLSCFWHGRYGAKRPSVPKLASEVLKLIPADLELDFDTDSEVPEQRRA